MGNQYQKPEDMPVEELAEFIIDQLHRVIVHHTLWFREVEHQFGFEKALAAMKTAYPQAKKMQMKRLGKTLGFEEENGVPKALLNMPKEKLLELSTAIANNWIGVDGIWFQAVEFVHGMNDAKRCNDSCWTRFSPFEAWSIKEFLVLPEYPGLKGLEQALNFRMYGRVNVQSTIWKDENTLLFQMNDCRVQAARIRKGLPDYPCKTAGLVEYARFAEGIDKRIKTECVGCPPDPHPDDWFCAWRFTIPEASDIK